MSKVDYEQAHNYVSWNYIRFVLRIIGYGVKWMKWMEECIFSSTMSILVKESTIDDFKVDMGLRQGDPLSHFPFDLATEELA